MAVAEGCVSPTLFTSSSKCPSYFDCCNCTAAPLPLGASSSDTEDVLGFGPVVLVGGTLNPSGAFWPVVARAIRFPPASYVGCANLYSVTPQLETATSSPFALT